MPEVISQQQPQCRENAVTYLVKKHVDKATGQTTYGNLLKSLDLLHENYLNQFHDNTNVFLFHSGDFDVDDLQQLEFRYPATAKGSIQLVNLANSEFWELPWNLRKEDPSKWSGLFGMDERHSVRWNAVKVWDYFDQVNKQQGCSYRYIMRLNPDSFIYSPIKYDLFEHMKTNDFQYGYRMCSYELPAAQMVWRDFEQASLRPGGVTSLEPNFRSWDTRDCSFYNNFYVADLQLFLSRNVQTFLRFVDEGGYMYRHRVNDAVIHTSVVYAYTPAHRIHRFLDFTYEHFVKYRKTRCPKFGALQAGYNDPNAIQTISEWKHIFLDKRDCPVKEGETMIQTLQSGDLSPVYAHMSSQQRRQLSLLSITAGRVDSIGKGKRSG